MPLAFDPPYASLPQRDADLAARGFVLLRAGDVRTWFGADAAALEALHGEWNDLPADGHLKDGGHYRRRRHSCFAQYKYCALISSVYNLSLVTFSAQSR